MRIKRIKAEKYTFLIFLGDFLNIIIKTTIDK